MNKAGANIGLVLLTHGNIGQSLLEVAEFILGKPLDGVLTIPFQQSALKKTGGDDIKRVMDQANQGKGVLILTDLGGASPCNFAADLCCQPDVAVVSGLNLAMLIRTWTNRSKPLRQLVKIATDGAMRDIREFKK
jgi:mannose/fructose-specific phosphotransferase system component IIA